MSTTALTKVGTKNAEQVVLLDAAGDQVTSFGGGTQYADGAAAATPTGTQINWNDGGTQRAVSAAKPLPVTATIDTTGLATDTGQTTGNNLLGTIDTDTGAIATSTASIDTKTPALGQALAAASVPVVLPAAQITTLTPPAAITGFALETTATSIKTAVETIDNAIAGNEMQVDVVTSALPSGASTAAKQPALGTAGTASADVITVQGIASMTALKVDGSGVTQPVSGTVTVTATNLDVQSGGADLATSTQAGAIQTAVELIDDTVKVLGTDTYTEAATKGLVIGAVRRDADTTLVNTTNEIGPVQMNAAGQLKVEVFSGETLPVSLTSTTVTGTVAVTQSGTWDEVGINDSGNSITVDAPVGTPAFVRLSDGASAISTLPVSLASVPSHAVTNAGTFAVQVDGAALTALQLLDDTIIADNAGFTDGTTKVNMSGYIYDEVAGTSLTENDAAAARINANRAVVNAIEDGSTRGRYATVTASNALKVDNSGVTQPVSGTVTANLAAGTNNIGDVDILSIAAGDNNIGNVDIVTVNGQAPAFGTGTRSAATQRVTIATDDVVPAAQSGTWTVQPGNTANTTAWKVDGSAVTQPVSMATNTPTGTVADDGTTPSNPIMIGGKAVETDGTDPTSVSAEDDVAIFRTDRNRRLLVNHSHPNKWKVNENHSSAQTNNQLKAAPGANLSFYITDIIISNGATAGSVQLVEDEGGTPVTIAGPYYFAINGGMAMPLNEPIRMTANKSLGFTSVTCTTHSVTVLGYTAP